MKKSSRIWRRFYRKQNQMLLGGMGILASLICMAAVLAGWYGNQRYEASEGMLIADGGKRAVTNELLSWLGQEEGVKEIYPMVRTEGTVETEGFIWNGKIYGITFQSAPFNLLTKETKGSKNQPIILLEEGALKGFQKDGKKLQDEELQFFLEKTMKRGVTIKFEEGEEGIQINGVLGGIAEQRKEDEPAAYMEMEELRGILREKGQDDEVHEILIRLKEVKAAEEVIKALSEAGFEAENPYKEELAVREEKNQERLKIFALGVLLMFFTWRYLMQVLFPR